MKLSKLFNWKVILGIVVFLIIIFFSSIVELIINIQWFKEVGYLGVYMTRLLTQFKLGVPIFIILLAIFFMYLLFLKREYLKTCSVIYSPGQLKSINSKIFIISAVLSIIISAVISSSYWYDILKFMNGTSFNLKDPVFNKDISFFVFKLPMYKQLYSFCFTLFVSIIIITVVFYGITAAGRISPGYDENLGSNVFRMGRRGRTRFSSELIEIAGKQFGIMGFILFIMLGVGYVLKNYDLVYSPRGVAFGASYTDIHVSLLFNRILAVICILAAISVLYALTKRKVKLFAWIIGIMVVSLLAKGITEAAVQRFVVAPNEPQKESPYIKYNIDYTRHAYGLDKVEEKDFPVEQNLSAADIEKNKDTVDNIRVNEFKPALAVYNQMQGIRLYYRFNDIDIDRYTINGKYTQVFVAPRELDQSKLDTASQTWPNKHLVYTHGYGVAMSPVNTVTAEGQPNLIIKDIPPVSSVDIKVDRPEIYFGELTNDYVITNTSMPEMDYPSGNTNKTTTYSGSAGIKLNGLNRFLFMLNKGSINFLLSQNINSNSRILMNRNIMERVQEIAPFLVYDKDPYLVINNGKLYWIIDGYTVSDAYPYSEPTQGINYIRNSVKVIIDAYNGTTDFYAIDENDPLIMTYSKVFPGLFKKYSDVPKGFVEHFRYPEGIFNIQLDVYKKYHMTDPGVFYNKEDAWALATDGQSQQSKDSSAVESAYITMKLPEGADEEFMLMNSYTPTGKYNMVAWLSARMDGENYGKLIAYKFPKQKVTYGPSQFISRVNQDTTISKELSLWKQQGSDAEFGSVITIPIEKSMIYVAPLYIKSTGDNSIPEVKRVVLGYGDKIVMEETLDKALVSMFNLKQQDNTTTVQQNTTQGTAVSSDAQTLIKNANDVFQKAKEAQQNGDWAAYGNYLKQLEDILKQLDTISKK